MKQKSEGLYRGHSMKLFFQGSIVCSTQAVTRSARTPLPLQARSNKQLQEALAIPYASPRETREA